MTTSALAIKDTANIDEFVENSSVTYISDVDMFLISFAFNNDANRISQVGGAQGMYSITHLIKIYRGVVS